MRIGSDYLRVLSGLRIVVDKVVANGEPAFRDRAAKAQYHLIELSKLFYESYGATNPTRTNAKASNTVSNGPVGEFVDKISKSTMTVNPIVDGEAIVHDYGMI